jgi:hypothetical protein
MKQEHRGRHDHADEQYDDVQRMKIHSVSLNRVLAWMRTTCRAWNDTALCSASLAIRAMDNGKSWHMIQLRG